MLKYPNPPGTVRRQWCGPFAMAVLTGLSYDEAYAKCLASIRRDKMALRRRKYEGVTGGLEWSLKQWPLPTVVKGMHESELERVLGKAGVKVKWKRRPIKDALTLLTFVREHTAKGKTYLVVAGHHYMVLKDGVVYHSHYRPKPVEDMQRLRMARVVSWAEVKPRPAAIAQPEPTSDLAPA